jgi:hypothetical protein
VLAERGAMLAFFNDVDPGSAAPWQAAIQYFGTKGFFPTYDAAPDRPLDFATARIWIDACGHLLAGAFDPLRCARALARLPRTAGPAVTAEAFARLLADQLAFAAGGDWPAEELLAGLADRGAPLGRGDACRILAAAVWRRPPALTAPRL